ncbi:uncharacterized protein LOC113365282, partial [Ctenocephalides felis]|uniref:uncharacterized protein LOC113365282 n=1 Tax=Ctenocephalides felis TaxID=7515 RepID=UPI000E6E1AC5
GTELRHDLGAKVIISANSLALQKVARNWTGDITCLAANTQGRTPSAQLALRVRYQNFNKPDEVELLIGVDIFFEILLNEKIMLGKDKPVLQNTVFGWAVAGNFGNNSGPVDNLTASINHVHLTNSIARFWEIDEVNDSYSLSSDDEICERHFLENVSRDIDGSYVVALPLKPSADVNLGLSLQQAKRRFLHLEARFKRNSILKKQYSDFINEYIALGHAAVTNFDHSGMHYYLPHHAVFKRDSDKIRVVFDASAVTSTGNSLNDVLYTGPKLQQTDIVKMFRQIRVRKEDQDLQRILWREGPNETLKCLKLTTVTYGTACAPYLAIRCLHKLICDEGSAYPLACAALRNDCYVDDLITGSETLEQSVRLRDELIALFSKANMSLHKWAANDDKILKFTSLENEHSEMFDITDDKSSVKALGLCWNRVSDSFEIRTNEIIIETKLTKRKILSSIAKIFDPLGLISPFVVIAKIMMQDLWQLKISWDDIITDKSILTRWTQFVSDITILNDIKIPRPLFLRSEICHLQLHGFCDASIKAYGACIYVRTVYQNQHTSVNLLCSKSRVAPIKHVTLPRLELCSTLLLVRLYNSICKIFKHRVHDIFFWSDSSIALTWINTSPSKLKSFVGNRVSEIQKCTNVTWRHVPSADNPADLISRGVTGVKLRDCHLWWCGPQWLKSNINLWPEIFNVNETANLPEQELIRNTLLCTPLLNEIFTKFSNFNKLQRVVAFCLRFINNSKISRIQRMVGPLTIEELNFVSNHQRMAGPLTIEELNFASNQIIRKIQLENFKTLIDKLQNRVLNVSIDKHLLELNPFLDEQNILRVGGRLEKANISYDQKFPIILPAKNHVTDLILLQEHQRLLHAGVQTVLANIRLRFWPINARNRIKQIIKNCVRCYRHDNRNMQQIMGNLPKERVNISRPFLTTGIDYAGPFTLRVSKVRKAQRSKAYIALFICFCTKAIHLELVTSLTTEAFMAALKRFISRRGKCNTIFSDNGTNFIGARHELHQLYKLFKSDKIRSELVDAASIEGIAWKFSPPHAPHFGGLWESAVKLAKHHIRRVIGSSCLTYEEFTTVLTQIEAVLNSRPITGVYENPSEPTFLTPGHFLIGDALTAFPEPALVDININRLSLWQNLTRLRDMFWKKWSIDYLSLLQKRYKWQLETPNIKINDVVLLKEDNLPPLNWLLGRITNVNPGTDGKVRVVTVKTKAGIYVRPITRICPLPNGDFN